MVVYVDTLKEKNGYGRVLKVGFGPESDFPWAHTHNKKSSAPLRPPEADKRARPCIYTLQNLGFALPETSLCPRSRFLQSPCKWSPLPAGQKWGVSDPSSRYWPFSAAAAWGNSGLKQSMWSHYKCCIFIRGKRGRTTATPVHEFASYHCSSLLRGAIWFILWVIWVTFTLREKIMVT